MRKNGFIATSLIYSFFLIFCALLVAFVGVFLHNKTLLANITNDITNDLNTTKTVGNKIKNVGDYFILPITRNHLNIDDVTWMFLKNDGTYSYFVSDSNLFFTANYDSPTNLQTDFNNFRSLYLKEIKYPEYNGTKFLGSVTLPTMGDSDTDSLNHQLMCVSPDNLYLNGASVSSLHCETTPIHESDSSPITSNDTYSLNTISATDGTNYPIRGVIKVSNNVQLTGGTGTRNDPYIAKYYETEGLLHFFDSRNSSGYGTSTPIYDLTGNYYKPITALNGVTDSNYIKIDYIDIDNTIITNSIYSALKDNGDYTLEYKTSNEFKMAIMNKDMNETRSYIFQTGNVIKYLVSGSLVVLYDGSSIGLTNKTISIVKEGVIVKVYVDGVQVNDTNSNHGFNLGSTTLLNGTVDTDIIKIGSSSSSNISFIRFYKKALQAPKISANFALDGESGF